MKVKDIFKELIVEFQERKLQDKNNHFDIYCVLNMNEKIIF